MKLSAKFARQETEPQRLKRVARRRIREDRIKVVRRMLGLTEEAPKPHTAADPSSPSEL